MAYLRTCRVLLLVGILKLCCADKPKCTAIFNGTTTNYVIHKDHAYVNNSDDYCDFSWCNIRNIVFANQQAKLSLVENWSINNLTTKGCYSVLVLKRYCISEGKAFTASCNASCDDFPKATTDNDNPRNSTSSFDPNHAVVPVVVVFLILSIFIGVILYRKRKTIFRNQSCSQIGGMYSAGKPITTNSNMV